jgi:hypothetical protein
MLITYFASLPGVFTMKIPALDYQTDKSTWGELMPTDELRKMREFNELSFLRERQHIPVVTGNRFKAKYLQFYTALPYISRSIMYLDAAYSTGSRDAKSCILLSTDGLKYYVEDIYCTKGETLDNALEWIVMKVLEYRDRGLEISCYFEANFVQKFILDREMRRIQNQLGVYIAFIPDERVKANKQMTIESLSSYYDRYQIFFSEKLKGSAHWREFETELMGWSLSESNSVSDDG